METLDEFLEFVYRETGLEVAPAQADASFDDLAGWDSVYLLALLTALEKKTGHRVSLTDALEARSLADIYRTEATR
jgi:acyl carrier protein